MDKYIIPINIIHVLSFRFTLDEINKLNNYFINHFDFTLRDVFVFMLEDLDIFKLDNEIELV